MPTLEDTALAEPEVTAALKARSISLRNKLRPADIGNPKAIAALPENVLQLVLGRMVGVVNGVKTGTMPDKMTTYTALTGTFRGIPSDTERDIISSGVCFMPPNIQSMIEDQFEDELNSDGEVIKEGIRSLEFGYEVSVVRSNNPQGYSWAFRPLIEPAASDPLAALMAKIDPPKQLADPVEPETPPANEPAPKGKGK